MHKIFQFFIPCLFERKNALFSPNRFPLYSSLHSCCAASTHLQQLHGDCQCNYSQALFVPITSDCNRFQVWESITGIVAKLDVGQNYTHELVRVMQIAWTTQYSSREEESHLKTDRTDWQMCHSKSIQSGMAPIMITTGLRLFDTGFQITSTK